MKLHLGCGNTYLDSYTNIDIMSSIADAQMDVRYLTLYRSKCIDEIYACHLLEHFKKKDLIDILLEWKRVLKIGGKLRIAVPNFDSVVTHYNDNKDINAITGLVCGGQHTEYDIHYNIFNFDILSQILSDLGFNNIQLYDSYEFLKDNDDYSKAMLPHMDKNGQLMSLNIICENKDDNINISDSTKKFLRLI